MNVTCNQGTGSSAQEPPIIGSGHLAERRVTLAASARIWVGSGFRATLVVDPRLDDEIALSLRADDNILPHVVAELQAGGIVVGLEQGRYSRLSELSVAAKMSRLSEVVVTDAASVSIRGLHGENVSLRADNASRIDAAGQAERWHVDLANASIGRLAAGQSAAICIRLGQVSELTLQGSSVHTDVEASGASRLVAAAPRFETRRVHVQLSALSSARLYALDAVTGQVTGLSKLRVAGGAQIDVDGKVFRG